VLSTPSVPAAARICIRITAWLRCRRFFLIGPADWRKASRGCFLGHGAGDRIYFCRRCGSLDCPDTVRLAVADWWSRRPHGRALRRFIIYRALGESTCDRCDLPVLTWATKTFWRSCQPSPAASRCGDLLPQGRRSRFRADLESSEPGGCPACFFFFFAYPICTCRSWPDHWLRGSDEPRVKHPHGPFRPKTVLRGHSAVPCCSCSERSCSSPVFRAAVPSARAGVGI